MYFKNKLFFIVLIIGLQKGVSQVNPTINRLDSLLEKATDYYSRQDYKNAIETNALLIDEASKANSTYYMFRGYNELGTIYSNDLRDSLKAFSNHKKALELALISKTDTLLSWAYKSLGNVYSDIGRNPKKGIEYYKESIAINQKNKENNIKNLNAYINIGETYLNQEEYDLAYTYLIKSKSLSNVKEQQEIFYTTLQLLFGRYYLGKEKYNIAIRELDQVAKKASISNYVLQGADAYGYLAKAYEAQGQFKSAHESLKHEKMYRSRIIDLEKIKGVEEASAKFELEQYQRDLDSAHREQEFTDALVKKSGELTKIFIILSLVFLIAFIALFLLFRARKTYIKRLHDKNEELTSAKNEAERLSKLKTRFFSTVSHELRTPLYGVIGLSSILLEDKNLASHKEDLTSLKFSANYLMALINDVLTINKMDANGIRLEKTPFRLSRLINNINKSFEFSAEQNKNKIHLYIDKEIPDHLIGDSVRLSQILMNLVGNAVKFNENGNIWVSIKVLNRTKGNLYRTQFTVKDDGIGIPQDKHQSIFEEFSQVENKNYNYQGTGLGLPIVKKLLTLYNSEIELKSSPGEGAVFSFIIDLEKDSTNQVLEYEKTLPNEVILNESAFSNFQILVVDDNKINQKITQKILETRHFRCTLVEGGEEAISMVKHRHFDLVLMDIHMPGINGLEATIEIRKFNKNIPIVALTAVEADEILKSIHEVGMNDLILKPYDISQFLTTILRNLRGKIKKIS